MKDRMKDEMQRAETMREVLEQLEGRLAGRRVFRFMSDLGVTDISCEQFFSDIRRTAFLIEDTGLSGKHIGAHGTEQLLVDGLPMCSVLVRIGSGASGS